MSYLFIVDTRKLASHQGNYQYSEQKSKTIAHDHLATPKQIAELPTQFN
ncbi:MAG: hypothetical protein U5L01_08345 [Rheinheimera sp.]|nr:hypothetical protein [Rheinheimera sp.]